MDKLSIVNLPATSDLPELDGKNIFTLTTCQRRLVIGRGRLLQSMPCTCFEFYVGVEAYQFLLEVICGLKSHLLAENEITAQFKNAYNEYSKREGKDTGLLLLLEKLFKDAKEVRSQFLNQLGQQSYASITRSFLSKKIVEGEVLVLGSGGLAFSLAKLLKKKYRVSIAARNEIKQNEICSVFNLQKENWAGTTPFYKYKAIINTIGTEDVLYDDNFFNDWLTPEKLFIDLANPSPVQSIKTFNEGLIRLEDIFRESDQRSEEKQHKIALAKEFISELAFRRHHLVTSLATSKGESASSILSPL